MGKRGRGTRAGWQSARHEHTTLHLKHPAQPNAQPYLLHTRQPISQSHLLTADMKRSFLFLSQKYTSQCLQKKLLRYIDHKTKFVNFSVTDNSAVVSVVGQAASLGLAHGRAGSVLLREGPKAKQKSQNRALNSQVFLCATRESVPSARD